MYLISDRSTFLEKSEARLMVEENLAQWSVLVLEANAEKPILCVVEVIE